MILSHYVLLGALPLTSNGKLNRKALSTPNFRPFAIRPPRSAQKEILVSLFAETFGIAELGINDNFFELGGHSLLATKLISRIRTSLGVEESPSAPCSKPQPPPS